MLLLIYMPPRWQTTTRKGAEQTANGAEQAQTIQWNGRSPSLLYHT